MSTIIGIAGCSCSGKTTHAKLMAQRAAKSGKSVVIISMDNYYRPLAEGEDGSKYNWDLPDSFDIAKLRADIMRLRDGQPIESHAHDYSAYKNDGKANMIQPAEVIIVEGLYVLHDDLLDLFTMTFFVDATLSTMWRRRLDRDLRERYSDIKEVETRWNNDVVPAYTKYVLPQREKAGKLIPNETTEALESAAALLAEA